MQKVSSDLGYVATLLLRALLAISIYVFIDCINESRKYYLTKKSSSILILVMEIQFQGKIIFLHGYAVLKITDLEN